MSERAQFNMAPRTKAETIDSKKRFCLPIEGKPRSYRIFIGLKGERIAFFWSKFEEENYHSRRGWHFFLIAERGKLCPEEVQLPEYCLEEKGPRYGKARLIFPDGRERTFVFLPEPLGREKLSTAQQKPVFSR